MEILILLNTTKKKLFKEINNIDLNTIDYEKHKEFIKEIPNSIWNKIEG